MLGDEDGKKTRRYVAKMSGTAPVAAELDVTGKERAKARAAGRGAPGPRGRGRGQEGLTISSKQRTEAKEIDEMEDADVKVFASGGVCRPYGAGCVQLQQQ